MTRDDTAWRLPAGSLDRWPHDYERGRPGWPAAAVRVARPVAWMTALELGAGTGKLTRLLTPSYERVVAVEPEDAMRRMLATLCPDAEPVAGTAEEIPQADASVDAVFTAEAFHRFDGRRALAEIARILRPHGVLVLMWNLPATGWEPSAAAAERLLGDRLPPGELSYDPFDLGSVIFTSGEWRTAFAGSAFEPLRERRFPNPQTLDRDGLVSFLASMGWIADLPDGERLPLLDDVRSRLAASSYRRTWETHVFWTRLAPADDVA